MVVAGHVKTGLNIKEIIVSPFLRISENCLLKQSANLFPMIESYIIKKIPYIKTYLPSLLRYPSCQQPCGNLFCILVEGVMLIILGEEENKDTVF